MDQERTMSEKPASAEAPLEHFELSPEQIKAIVENGVILARARQEALDAAA